MMTAAEHDADAASWLLCRAGRHLCALALEQVIESMRLLPFEALSAAPRCVRGLCVYRGSAVPVVDVGLLLGEDAIHAGRLVAIRTGGRIVALAVASVLGVRSFTAESAQAMPPLLREAANDAVSAIGIMDEELLLFLGTARIMPEALAEEEPAP
jgi:purine-binding chemotaxis protein CheW